jgi:hypothetical protein
MFFNDGRKVAYRLINLPSIKITFRRASTLGWEDRVMTKFGLRKHPKFLLAVHILQEPEPHVYGYIEFIFEASLQRGNNILGSDLQVELIAKYPGTTGRLCATLFRCGFIHKTPGGHYSLNASWEAV